MKKSTLRRMDLVTSIILMALALVFFLESTKLFANPFLKDKSMLTDEMIRENLSRWYESPGLLPTIVSILMFICAIIILVHALKCGARFDFLTSEKINSLKTNHEFVVFLKVISLLAVYIFILIPLCRNTIDFFRTFDGFPFMIATFVYIFVNSYIFGEKTKKATKTALIVAVGSSLAITIVFNKLALIPLP